MPNQIGEPTYTDLAPECHHSPELQVHDRDARQLFDQYPTPASYGATTARQMVDDLIARSLITCRATADELRELLIEASRATRRGADSAGIPVRVEITARGRRLIAEQAAQQAADSDDRPPSADATTYTPADVPPGLTDADMARLDPAPGPEPCPECGHPADHDPNARGGDLGSCDACNDAAQLGQYAPCQYVDPDASASGGAEGIADDLPPGATVEPWTDADTAELGELMYRASRDRRDRWMAMRSGAELDRWHRVTRAHLMPHELRSAAARFGIVADPDALPYNTSRAPLSWAHPASMDPATVARLAEAHRDRLMREEAIARQHETQDVWAGIVAARADKTTHRQRYYEASDAFDEHVATTSLLRRLRFPIIAAALATAEPAR